MAVPPTLIKGPPIHENMISAEYLSTRYLRERSGDFTDTTLSAKLGSIPCNRLVLLPPEISGIDINTQDDQLSVHLTLMSELSAGRENNRSEVGFGQLHIVGSENAPTSELIAAKYIHRLTAPRELNAARAINKRFGKDVAFSPVGFVRAQDGKVGYLSRYEQSVTTLDNILWEKSSTSSQRTWAMGFAGLWLASLHNHGIIHGDAQAKNIAYDSASNLRYVDLEGATELGKNGPDPQTERLLDIANLFDRTYMPPVTIDEMATFADAYTNHQDDTRGTIDEADIFDTVDSMYENEP